jgi:hypothetical protein
MLMDELEVSSIFQIGKSPVFALIDAYNVLLPY